MIQVSEDLMSGKGVRIVLTSAESPPGLPLPPLAPSCLLVQRLQVAKGSDLDQDSCITPNVRKKDGIRELRPPLEVVARSKAVAKASPWDCGSAIVAREASRPEKGVVGGVGGGIAGIRGEVVALGSPKA